VDANLQAVIIHINHLPPIINTDPKSITRQKAKSTQTLTTYGLT